MAAARGIDLGRRNGTLWNKWGCVHDSESRATV